MNELCKKAINTLRGACAKKEHAPLEVLQKLQNLGLSPAEAQKGLEILENENYVDSLRFCRAFVHDYFFLRHWGKIKISYALAQKGIEQAQFEIIWQELISQEQEEEQVYNLLCKKKKQLGLSILESKTLKNKTQLFNYLLRKGFPTALITKVWYKYNDSDEVD